MELSKEQRALRRFLLALCCGDQSRADDLAQETLIKAYLSIERYSEIEKFSSWLKKIAYNTFLDNVKTQRPLWSLEAATTVKSPVETDDFLKYQDLYMALDKLSPKERSAILLYYMDGYSIKEICEIVDCSECAVKQQLSRGRKQLKTMLEDGR